MSNATITPVPERLAELEKLSVDRNGHPNFDAGHCAMELVAWLADEPHSASPQCADPTISSLAVRLNDSIYDDARRTEVMKPLLPRIVGTRGSTDLNQRRRWAVNDWLARDYLPFILDWAAARGQTQLAEHAAALRALPEIVDRATHMASYDARSGARQAAYAARVEARKRRQEIIERIIGEKYTATDADAAAATADAATAATADAATAAAADAATAADADAATAADAAAAATAATAADAATDADAAAADAPSAAYHLRWEAAYRAARKVYDADAGIVELREAVQAKRAELIVRLIEVTEDAPVSA